MSDILHKNLTELVTQETFGPHKVTTVNDLHFSLLLPSLSLSFSSPVSLFPFYLSSLLLSLSLSSQLSFLNSLSSLLSHSLVMSLFFSLNGNDNDHSYNELSVLTALS